MQNSLPYSWKHPDKICGPSEYLFTLDMQPGIFHVTEQLIANVCQEIINSFAELSRIMSYQTEHSLRTAKQMNSILLLFAGPLKYATSEF